MSEEEMHFKRSHIGHDANDLHDHGGLDAHEEKTAREDLEDANEALDDDADIEEINDNSKAIEEALAEEPKAEPEEEPVEADSEDTPKDDWKSKTENQPYMTVDKVIDPEKKGKKGGAVWKVTTFLFLIIALA